MFNLQALFEAERFNPQNPMNRAGRLMGQHCQARLQRAQAKRKRLNRGHGKIVSRRPYAPA